MRTAAVDLIHPETTPSDRPPSQSEFPPSVDWSNPRVAAILDSAARCFSRVGFTTTTLADIGKELGLRKSIVHYYFASKATLVREVQSYAYGKYLEVVRSTLLGEHSPDGPVSGTTPTSKNLALSGLQDSGLGALWVALGRESSLRGLNLELWSEGRRNPELSARAEVLDAEAQKLIASHFESTGSGLGLDPDDLATLTLAVLDGLTVRQERERSSVRTTKAFATFLKLLKK